MNYNYDPYDNLQQLNTTSSQHELELHQQWKNQRNLSKVVNNQHSQIQQLIQQIQSLNSRMDDLEQVLWDVRDSDRLIEAYFETKEQNK